MIYTREHIVKSMPFLQKKSQSIAQADLYLVNIGGECLIFKDFSGRFLPARCLIGRVAISREVRAYRHLEGIPGIPRFICQPDSDSFLMEYIEGQSLACYKKKTPPTPAVFTALSELVERMHQRGVAHGDLHKRNILVSSTDIPYILDFATSLCITEKTGWLKKALFRKMCRIDRLAILKIKVRFFPHLLTAEEKCAIERLPWYMTIGRFLRKKIYRPFIKAKYWHRRWHKMRSYIAPSHNNDD